MRLCTEIICEGDKSMWICDSNPIKNVAELIATIESLSDFSISTNGGDCYVHINKEEKEVVFEDKDYSQSWNEFEQ